jgi:hypothetical protein
MRIRSSYPTPEEVGKILGLSKARVRWINKMVHECIFERICKEHGISKKTAEIIRGLDISGKKN